MLRIGLEETANHPLILRVVLRCLTLEEVDTSLGQCKGNLHALFAERKILQDPGENPR